MDSEEQQRRLTELAADLRGEDRAMNHRFALFAAFGREPITWQELGVTALFLAAAGGVLEAGVRFNSSLLLAIVLFCAAGLPLSRLTTRRRRNQSPPVERTHD